MVTRSCFFRVMSALFVVITLASIVAGCASTAPVPQTTQTTQTTCTSSAGVADDTVTCANTTCPLLSGCCAEDHGSVPGWVSAPPSCAAHAQDSGTACHNRHDCDDASDCPAGTVCCLGVNYLTGSTSACAAHCPIDGYPFFVSGGSVQLCHTDCECIDGASKCLAAHPGAIRDYSACCFGPQAEVPSQGQAADPASF